MDTEKEKQMFGKHVFAGPGRNSETQRKILTDFEGFLHVHTPCSYRYRVIHSDDFLSEQVLCLRSLGSRRVCVRAKSLQLFQLSATPRTVARQAPLSVGYYRQEYWSGLPCHLHRQLGEN